MPQPVDPTPAIEHTLLDSRAGAEAIRHLCAEAVHYRFGWVCVYPCWVKLARELLQKEPVQVVTVIGFPSGSHTSPVKLYEAQQAIEDGAQELDVVLNLSYIKAGNSDLLYQDIAPICDQRLPVKAILEMPVLTEAEWTMAIEVCIAAGVRYIKTCTGWRGGVDIRHIHFLKQHLKGKAGIKAAGGIRSLPQAQALIEAGSDRLGTSYGVSIVEAWRQGT
jgi:deoxyribose-phosphate aldolase